MGKIYKNLISTTAGFNYAAPQPLDDREVVQSYSDLAELVSSNQSYEGIEVYVKDDAKSYKLIGDTWKAVATEDDIEAQTKTDTALPEDHIILANTMYVIGEIDSLTIGFPATANLCDMVYVSFTTGETVPEFSFTTDNHIGLNCISKLKNHNYELIGMWNGAKWVFAVHEVEL